jgi:hypothetical protein
MGRSRNQYQKQGRGGGGGESRRDRRITHFISSASDLQASEISLHVKDDSNESLHHNHEEDGEGEEEEEMVVKSAHIMTIPVKLWEFGQNDPKKDSGSR